MNEILDKLKKHFNETPREEILKGWQEAKKNAPKNSPKIKDFLNQKCLHDTCPSCNGTGVKENGLPCIHMIACPCSKCSPKYF